MTPSLKLLPTSLMENLIQHETIHSSCIRSFLCNQMFPPVWDNTFLTLSYHPTNISVFQPDPDSTNQTALHHCPSSSAAWQTRYVRSATSSNVTSPTNSFWEHKAVMQNNNIPSPEL